MNSEMSEGYQTYNETMENELKQLYDISKCARSIGLDPSLKTECVIAKDIADLVEGLVGPKDVAVSIRELNSKMQREEIAFKMGYLSEADLLESADNMANSNYGQYLRKLVS